MAPYCPSWLREVGAMLSGKEISSDPMQAACHRFVTLLDQSPQTVAAFARNMDVCGGVDARAWAACALLWVVLGSGSADSEDREVLERFALLGVDEDGAVGAALAARLPI